ncbi:rhodanese-like domain-containing protein 8, chloroplastic [Mercurialis annua]|uniref:rhodanese-like domain-containing protein 8, chloroplastic n=1 Tax=Mercurialis annua TaxID=3986 RepID=UPI00216088F0|nr:rhodanese-like domain-containing protein 8, chloroplastic [Mercurialis annua]
MRVCSAPINLSSPITIYRHNPFFFLLPPPNKTSFTTNTFCCHKQNYSLPHLNNKHTHSKFNANLSACEAQLCPDDFLVVNFYRFVSISDPKAEVAKHLAFLKDLDIYGRIYLNEQGINAQYSGPSKDAVAYVEWIKEDLRFCDIEVQISPAPNGHAFPKLKLRYKPSLVQMEGGTAHLPLLDPAMRATPLTPSEWRKRLDKVRPDDVVLDVRNGYEWDIGHFVSAQRPHTECFRTTSCDPLATADRNTTDIFMYCTGGIRCDVYSIILRKQGFRNLYTLMGGVSNYLNQEGPGQTQWVGNLFVFDHRLSLPPSAYNPHATAVQLPQKFANCYVCGSHVYDLKHRNCANLDCNLLFLCCIDCLKDFKGCCCIKCTTAPRLRPLLPSSHRYEKWHIYRELEEQINVTV